MKKKFFYLIALLGLFCNFTKASQQAAMAEEAEQEFACVGDGPSRRITKKPIFPFISEGFDRAKYPELDKFVMRYGYAESLEGEDLEKGNEYDRIVNAERLRYVISKYNLNCFAVAKKYLHKDPTGLYRVCSEKISSSSEGFYFDSITPEEYNQLIKLIEITGYTDLTSFNFIRNIDTGKITFIDTEDRSFACYVDASCNFKSRFLDLRGYYASIDSMHPETSLFRNNKSFKKILSCLRELRKEELTERLLPCTLKKTLAYDNQYDKEIGINFERVKAELRHMQGKPLRARL